MPKNSCQLPEIRRRVKSEESQQALHHNHSHAERQKGLIGSSQGQKCGQRNHSFEVIKSSLKVPITFLEKIQHHVCSTFAVQHLQEQSKHKQVSEQMVGKTKINLKFKGNYRNYIKRGKRQKEKMYYDTKKFNIDSYFDLNCIK